jgi:cell wall assembly regulator SMI1
MSLENVWQRIASWYKDNTPSGLPLAKGASEKQVARLEKTLEQTLPADIRESYLLHNGTGGAFLLYFGELMTLDGIERIWQRYGEWQRTNSYGIGDDWTTRAEGPIKPYWWGPARIPLTDNGGGDPVFLDLDPAKGGRRGQLIKYSHEVGPQFVLAGSFAKWLKDIAHGLDDGKFVYDEEAETVAPPGMYG